MPARTCSRAAVQLRVVSPELRVVSPELPGGVPGTPLVSPELRVVSPELGGVPGTRVVSPELRHLANCTLSANTVKMEIISGLQRVQTPRRIQKFLTEDLFRRDARRGRLPPDVPNLGTCRQTRRVRSARTATLPWRDMSLCFDASIYAGLRQHNRATH